MVPDMVPGALALPSHSPNGISIGSAVLAKLTNVTDRQTPYVAKARYH